ncbi:restriction endonuclease [Actinacidiphila glaucinigra]|uniref:restriction endonuclease n=1 Tax=Actinacidiphila glaucinigra TaxID=235986 RepID=UPI0036C45E51
MTTMTCPLCRQSVSATRHGVAQHVHAGMPCPARSYADSEQLPGIRTRLVVLAGTGIAIMFALGIGSWSVFWLGLLLSVAGAGWNLSGSTRARIERANYKAIALVEEGARQRQAASVPTPEKAAQELRKQAEKLLRELPPLGATVEGAVAACMTRLHPHDPQPLAVRLQALARSDVAADERILGLAVMEGGPGVPESLLILTSRAAVVKTKSTVYRDDAPEVHDGEYGALSSGARTFHFSSNPGLRVAVEARKIAASQKPKARTAERPAERLIRDARDAELVATQWMRYFGFTDAVATLVGADGGIDVTSAAAIAQVKMEGKATGRPVVQQLHGVATSEGKKGVFFSLAGYTPQARTWAEPNGIALFRYHLQGTPQAVNAVAHAMLEVADARAGSSRG